VGAQKLLKTNKLKKYIIKGGTAPGPSFRLTS